MGFDSTRFINQQRFLVQALSAARFDDFEALLDRTERVLQPIVLEAVGEQATSEQIAAYFERDPEHWLASALMTHDTIRRAWEVRGTARARDTPPEHLEAHSRMIAQAYETARHAYAASHHPYAFSRQAICFMVLVHEVDPLLDIFEEYCERYPIEDAYVLLSVVQALHSKWCEFTLEQWLDWVDELRARFRGSVALFSLVDHFVRDELVHFYGHDLEQLYRDDHEMLLEDFRGLEASKHTTHPALLDSALNCLARDLWYVDDLRTARAALSLCQDRVLAKPWKEHFDSRERVLDALHVPWWKFWVR